MANDKNRDLSVGTSERLDAQFQFSDVLITAVLRIKDNTSYQYCYYDKGKIAMRTENY